MLRFLRHYAKAAAEKEAPVGSALPPFFPKQGLDKLPDVKGIKPETIDMPRGTWQKRQPQTLLRSIDFENRLRYDADGRSKLFNKEDKDYVKPGSIVLVEQITSRTQPRKQLFAGVLTEIKRHGITTNITLRTVIQGVGVEKKVPVYAPSVTKIVTLKRVGDEVKTVSGGPLIDKLSKESLDEIKLTEVEDLLVKYKNQEIKREQDVAKVAGKK